MQLLRRDVPLSARHMRTAFKHGTIDTRSLMDFSEAIVVLRNMAEKLGFVAFISVMGSALVLFDKRRRLLFYRSF